MKNKPIQPTAERLAHRFAAILRQWLNRSEMRKVISLNRYEKNKGICHSHDFCDANMAMDEAFESLTGHEFDVHDSDPNIDLWNAAWELAKTKHFFSRSYNGWTQGGV